MHIYPLLNRFRGAIATRLSILTALGILIGLAVVVCAADPAEGSLDSIRAKATADMQAGNWKDAYEGFSNLVLNSKSDGIAVAYELGQAVQCLNQLNRVAEVDDLVEKAVAIHKDNWRLVACAGIMYQETSHHGMIIGGVFERAAHGRGKYVSSAERDRVRSLQLMGDAMELIKKGEIKTPASEISDFYMSFSNAVIAKRWSNNLSWQLQNLTDLSQLPDYEEGQYGISQTSGAAVDAEGNPIFYSIPASFESAKNDGERWRFMLKSAKEADPTNDRSDYEFAQFLKQQFGVETMQRWDILRMQAGSPHHKQAGSDN